MSQGSRLALLALVPLLALAAGCSSEEGGKNPALPLAAPSIVIRSVGGVSQPHGTVEVGLGCDERVPVSVAIANFTLRPPGACFGYPQCGQLAVLVDPVETADGGPTEAALIDVSATSFVSLDFGALPSPEGTHLVRAELWLDGTSTVAHTSDGKPLAQEITVSATLPAGCDAGSEGDGSADAGDAGLEDGATEEPEDAALPDDAAET